MSGMILKSKAFFRYLKDARCYTVNAQANVWDCQQVDNEDPVYSIDMAIHELEDAILVLTNAKNELISPIPKS